MNVQPMIYGEIIIGLPGSGKTTYITDKKNFLADRNVFTVNLDPGSLYDTKDIEYDFDIKNFYTTKQKMMDESYGPNFAVKNILKEFCSEYSTFNSIFADEEAYYLIDTPGQVESIVILEKFLSKLQRDNIRLVTVFLIEISSFMSYDMMTYTYLMSLQTMIALNNTQINVITKCDLIDKIEIVAGIDQIVNLTLDSEKIPGFLRLLYDFVEREAILGFELLEYQKTNISSLQYVIDQASGYLYEISEDSTIGKYLEDVEQKEDIIQRYLLKQKVKKSITEDDK